MTEQLSQAKIFLNTHRLIKPQWVPGGAYESTDMGLEPKKKQAIISVNQARYIQRDQREAGIRKDNECEKQEDISDQTLLFSFHVLVCADPRGTGQEGSPGYTLPPKGPRRWPGQDSASRARLSCTLMGPKLMRARGGSLPGSEAVRGMEGAPHPRRRVS